MRSTILATAVVLLTTAAYAQTAGDKATSGIGAMVLYYDECGASGKVPVTAAAVINSVIEVYGKAKVMDSYLEWDEKRKKIGNEKFCPLVQEFVQKVLQAGK